MNLFKWKIFIALVLSGATVGTPAIVFGVGKASLSRVGARLSAEMNTICVGEPLICKLKYMYETDSNAPPKEVLHGARVDVIDSNDHTIVQRYRVFPSLLFRERTKGLVTYSGDFSLFWNTQTKEGLIFDRPGRYEVTLTYQADLDQESFRPLSVVVKAASKSNLRALALLSDPNDYAFLELGEHDYPDRRPERMAHLKKVVEQCEGTLLAKWSAGRLGVEYFEEFHRKHPSFIKFKAKYRGGEIKEPLFDQALDYLSMGTDLPDEFALRENVLYLRSRVEFIKGDYEKAASLFDELAAKYPHGEYGKRATRAKAELLELQKREPVQAPRPWVSGWGRLLPLFFVIAAGIFLIAYLLVVKKRAGSRGK